MIEDIELRFVKKKIETKETQEGKITQVVYVLKGCDLVNDVELSITLKAEDVMPEIYRRIVGKFIGDNTVFSLGKSTRQTEL